MAGRITTKRSVEMVEGALRVAGEYKARAEAAERYLTECRRIMDVLDVSDQELMMMGKLMESIHPGDQAAKVIPAEKEYRKFLKTLER